MLGKRNLQGEYYILGANKTIHLDSKGHMLYISVFMQDDWEQGWGGPAVHYRQSTPVLGNCDWRSYFYDPGIVRTCTEDLYRVPGPLIYEDWWTGDWWAFEELPHP